MTVQYKTQTRIGGEIKRTHPTVRVLILKLNGFSSTDLPSAHTYPTKTFITEFKEKDLGGLLGYRAQED